MKKHEIKIVSRNRSTGEEIINISSEDMARAIYGDRTIDAVISCGKIENILMER